MRRAIAGLALVACNGADPAADAASVDAFHPDAGADAAADARPVEVEACEAMPPPDTTGERPPVPGTYCATWTRIDGITDPFPRYFDRVAFATVDGAWSARWYTESSSGAEHYEAGASLELGCLAVDQFTNGLLASDPLRICWDAAGATSVLRWCRPGGVDEHWRVVLIPC